MQCYRCPMIRREFQIRMRFYGNQMRVEGWSKTDIQQEVAKSCYCPKIKNIIAREDIESLLKCSIE